MFFKSRIFWGLLVCKVEIFVKAEYSGDFSFVKLQMLGGSAGSQVL